MDALKFSIDDIPSRGLPVKVDVPTRAIQPEGVPGLPIETLHLEGNLVEAGGDYIFRGRMSGVFSQACDRCLEPLELPLDVEIVWTFEEGAAVQVNGLEKEDDLDALALEEEGAVHRFNGSVLDLSPYLWEELALAVPSKFVCDLTDMTTCPYYNAPRDASSGEAGDVSVPLSQFAVLKDLLPELNKGQHSEE